MPKIKTPNGYIKYKHKLYIAQGRACKYVSAWDWQWYYTLASQNQLCIYPAVNLVSNIGNDPDATHTSFGKITYQSYELDFPLKHPGYVCPNEAFDRAFWKEENSLRKRLQRSILNKLKTKIKALLKR